MADFQRVQLRTAQVLEARSHPKADKLVVMKIQLGAQTKQIVAGLRPHYAPEQLVGRTVIVVDNLEPARLRGELSEAMLLAVVLPEGGLRLLTTDGPAASGLAVS
jgi:methionyl-tRNA synthetase